MIQWSIENEPELLESLQGKADLMIAALKRKLDVLDAQLQAKIVEKVTGPVLKNHTGNLARSIEMIPTTYDGNTIEGAVQGGGGVAFYAKFQEFGTQGPYEIVPVNKQALAFFIGGQKVFAKKVTHPGLSARPFMQSSLDEMQQEIVDGLRESLREVAGK